MTNQSFINNSYLASYFYTPGLQPNKAPQAPRIHPLPEFPGRVVAAEELATEFCARHGATWRAGRRATDWAKVDGGWLCNFKDFEKMVFSLVL